MGWGRDRLEEMFVDIELLSKTYLYTLSHTYSYYSEVLGNDFLVVGLGEDFLDVVEGSGDLFFN